MYKVGDKFRVIAERGSDHGAGIGQIDEVLKWDANPATTMPVRGRYWYRLDEIEPLAKPNPFQAGDRVVIKGLGVRAVIDEVVLTQYIGGPLEVAGYRLGGGVSPVVVGADQIERVE